MPADQAFRVYITRRMHDAAERVLRDAGCEVTVSPHDRPMTPDELRQAASASDGMICFLNDKIEASLFEAAPRCRVYANYAVGFDNMDREAATRAGVALSNTPDVLTDATAEMAWALLFAAARHIVPGDRMTREGRFTGWAPLMLLGYDIARRTLGIVGAGRIGAAMAKRATGFEMQILYTRRSPGESTEMKALGARRVELDELLRESDFVSVHAPLNEQSRHMIGEREFSLMKKTAILINTGRGPVVGEKALVRALQSGQIAAAGLDVYEREPMVEPELFTMDNVVLAPHLGSATFETRAKMAELAAQNVLDALAGRVPRTCINPDYAANVNPSR